MAEKNGNGNGSGSGVKLGGMKLPLAVIGVIVVQAFGIIWYVANLDSTVKNLSANVSMIQEAATTVDVAVMQTSIENIKEKMVMMDEMHSEKFDPGPIEDDIDRLDEKLSLATLNVEDKLEALLRDLTEQVNFRILDLDNRISVEFASLDNMVDSVSDELRSRAEGTIYELNDLRQWVDQRWSEVDVRINDRAEEVEDQVDARVSELEDQLNYSVDNLRMEQDNERQGLEEHFGYRLTELENLANFRIPNLEEKLYTLTDQITYGLSEYDTKLDVLFADLEYKIEQLERDQEDDVMVLRERVTNGFAALAEAASMAIDEIDDKIGWLEQIVAVVENEMRTIMSDHERFGQILLQMGEEGYGDQRQYGDYEQQSQLSKGALPVALAEEPELADKQIARQAERQAERQAKKEAEEKAKKQAERQAARKAEREAEREAEEK